MVLQKIYVQYWYEGAGYFLPNAELYVCDTLSSGAIFDELCHSAFDGISTGCGFNLTEGTDYDVFSGKEGYTTNGDSFLIAFTAPVNPHILLWLYPCEPTVVTHNATDVTSSTARLNGELTDLDDCSKVYLCFQYGKVGESYTTLDEWWYNDPTEFSEEITGLEPDTTYNFRIRAANETEEDTFYVFGTTMSFTTSPLAVPEMETTWVKDITQTSAKLGGEAGTSGGMRTHYGFEYGKTTSYGTIVWLGYATWPIPYSTTVEGLDPDTLYHFRAIGENDDGTGYGADMTFTTLEEPTKNMQIVLPYATLLEEATVYKSDDWEVACTYFNFKIRNDGDETWNATYTVSIVDGSDLYQDTVTNLGAGATSAVIRNTICALPGGLPVGTHTIKVEVRPEGEAVTDTYTEVLTVLEETYPPEVVAMDASGVTQSGAILNANLTYTGDVSTHIGFEYGKTTSYGTTTWDKYTSTPGYYEKEVTGLEANTTYHFRPIVTNTNGTEYGVDKTFTTLEEPTKNMQIVLPYATLLEEATVYKSDDWEVACTYFNFKIRNDGDETWNATYTVSIVDGSDLYQDTVTNLGAGATSAVIRNTICALPGGLPVGTHTIKVEVRPEGEAVTDTYTEVLTVLEAAPPSGVGTTGERYLNVCGGGISDNCITVDIYVDYFGSDSECTVYLEYWSEGETEHNFTDHIIVPYDPEYEEGGFEVTDVKVCIPNCEKDHYIRAVASNSVGSNHSTTVTPITVGLEAPTEITLTSVTLNANILSMGTVSSGEWAFRYGTPTPNTWTTLLSIPGTGLRSTTVEGLEPNTTYQYYFLARNTFGYPSTESGTMSFTTSPPAVPEMLTRLVLNITQTSAKLGGKVYISDERSTHYGIEYGKTTSYGTIVWLGFATWDTAYHAYVEGLDPDTLYHYRAIGENDGGTGYGEDETFTTLPAAYDITFIATAPAIPDLHGVEVFIDGTSKGTT